MSSRPLLLISLILLLGCQPAKDKAAIGRQLQDYPESRVQDIYKSFCQDCLGPEHLIPNPESARNYLKKELAAYREDLDSLRYQAPRRLYYPVGGRGNYIRVDLLVVLNGQMSEDELLEAFVRSANEGKKLKPERWAARWNGIADVIRKHFPDIPDAERDLARLDSLIKDGNLIMHHSPAFSNAYHPHYRIVAKDLLSP